MIPVLIPKKYYNGTVSIGKKEFTYNDIKKGRVNVQSLDLPKDWYGGRVEYFGKTEDGFLLCVENGSQTVIGCYIPSLEGLTKNALDLLLEANIITENDMPVVKEEISETPSNEVDNDVDDIQTNVSETEKEPSTEIDSAEIERQLAEKVDAKIKARKEKQTK